MLQRVDHDNGVVTLRSPRLADAGVTHAFSTRVGGVSPPPFDSLNLAGLAKGGDHADDNARVAENFRRLRAAIGAERAIRVSVRQVHGRGVWRPPPGPVRPDDAPEADAMVSDDPSHWLTVRAADCLPVLMSTDDGRWVAAAHAGWRGLVAGVLPATVATLTEAAGADARSVVAAIGPGIGVQSYEVGPEVAEAFHDAGLGGAVRRDLGERPHLDLAAAATAQLDAAGVDASRIDRGDACTHRDAGLFFSYRRDGARSGRMAGVVRPRGR